MELMEMEMIETELESSTADILILASKLSSKGQLTLPKGVRERLGVEVGDIIAYEVKGDTVTISKVKPFDKAFHASVSKTLDEWNTPEDEEAFRDL